MAEQTKIEWTDATWTPVKGCTRVSPGCGGPGEAGGCYAEIMAARFSKPGQWGEGLARIVTLPDGRKDHRWTGAIRFDEAELMKPLRRKRGRKIFVCSTADLFHDGVTDAQIDRVFAIMALCPQHIFQVLTKRPARMRDYLSVAGLAERLGAACIALYNSDQSVSAGKLFAALGERQHADQPEYVPMPLPNVWLGVSVEDQQRADERIPILLKTPAAVRWLSMEPLLGPVDLTMVAGEIGHGLHSYDALRGLNIHDDDDGHWTRVPKLAWVVLGGESGPGARPLHPDWARLVRDQCAAAGVPFFFKQWGEWLPIFETPWSSIAAQRWPDPQEQSPFDHVVWNGEHWEEMNGCWDDSDSWYSAANYDEPEQDLARVGKKAAGRLLDDVAHDEFPEVRHADA